MNAAPAGHSLTATIDPTQLERLKNSLYLSEIDARGCVQALAGEISDDVRADMRRTLGLTARRLGDLQTVVEQMVRRLRDGTSPPPLTADGRQRLQQLLDEGLLTIGDIQGVYPDW